MLECDVGSKHSVQAGFASYKTFNNAKQILRLVINFFQKTQFSKNIIFKKHFLQKIYIHTYIFLF
jgi:transcriptional regulatory protein LevR